MKRVLILVTVLAFAITACDADGAGSADSTAGGEERVEMANLAFSPESLTVAAGTTVTWENTDSALPHTSNSDDEVWASGTLNGGDEFSFTFDEAGTFTYFCTIHPSMTGTIVVDG